MPRGRFESKSFYDNNRLNELPVETHFLFGGIFVVCADREGRCKGDAKWVNSQVFSLRDYSDKEVEGWLDNLAEAKDDDTGLGLIERYSVNGRSYIWIPGFEKHQRGRNKSREAESEIPPPPDELTSKRGEASLTTSPLPLDKGDKGDDLKVARMIKYYEDELGRTLTPTDLEKLKDFADNYPDGQFVKAVDEAKKNEAKAPMSYIGRILEHWRERGKPEEPSGDNQGIETI